MIVSTTRRWQTAGSKSAAYFMKTISLSILLALAFTLSAMFTASAIAQTLARDPKVISISWKLAKDWLTIERVNHKDDPDSWHPSFTTITVDKAYRPIIIEHEDHSFEIVFESNIQSSR